MDFYLIPLKLKNRLPNHRILHRPFDPKPDGTRVYSAGRFTAKSSNAGKAAPNKQGTGHRRRQGLGNTTITTE
jgi:hypothetical protein